MQVSGDILGVIFFLNKNKSCLVTWSCYLSTVLSVHCNSMLIFLKWVVFVSAVTQAGKGNFAMNVGPTQAVLMELAVSHGSATVSRNGVEFFVMKVKEASVQ